MSDQFQHIMVLASIIIGLGITQLLGGAGAVIERISGQGRPLKLGWIYGIWATFVFVWLVSFWWWQFRLLDLVTTWTMGRYLFILFYAVLLYLLVVILVPRQWDEVEDLDEYFMAKRSWFFSAFLLANVADGFDSYAKGGWEYLRGTGPIALGLLAVTIPVFIIGVRSKNMRVQNVMALVLLVWQIGVSFNVFPQLTI